MSEGFILTFILLVCLVALGLFDVWFFGRDRGKPKKKKKNTVDYIELGNNGRLSLEVIELIKNGGKKK